MGLKIRVGGKRTNLALFWAGYESAKAKGRFARMRELPGKNLKEMQMFRRGERAAKVPA